MPYAPLQSMNQQKITLHISLHVIVFVKIFIKWFILFRCFSRSLHIAAVYSLALFTNEPNTTSSTSLISHWFSIFSFYFHFRTDFFSMSLLLVALLLSSHHFKSKYCRNIEILYSLLQNNFDIKYEGKNLKRLLCFCRTQIDKMQFKSKDIAMSFQLAMCINKCDIRCINHFQYKEAWAPAI